MSTQFALDGLEVRLSSCYTRAIADCLKRRTRPFFGRGCALMSVGESRSKYIALHPNPFPSPFPPFIVRINNLQDRIKTHGGEFDSLLKLIPAQYYITQELTEEEQVNMRCQ